MRRSLAVALLLAALNACGEPPIQVEIPPRQPGQQVLDLAGLLDGQVADRLRAIGEQQGLDIVALTYETDAANCGEAFRAGGAFVRQWGAEVAIVAVAEPDGFTRPADDRQACFGVQPRDEFALPRSLREEIVERLTPPLTQQNRWSQAFLTAADELAALSGT
ncbi:MAG: TPM domain-containing protein [Egibacteraceae bacterium]